MTEQIQKTFRVLDLVSTLITGIYIGYERQRSADSGGIIIDKIIISMAIAAVSFLAGYLITYRLRQKTVGRIPLWVQVAVRGSFICALLLNCVYYVIYNWRYIQRYSSLGTVVTDRLTVLLVVTIGYSIFALFIMGLMHLINYGINRLQRSPSISI